jgi:CRP-like cAMP-binding protein
MDPSTSIVIGQSKYRSVYQYSSRYCPQPTLEKPIDKRKTLRRFTTCSTSSSRQLQDSKSVCARNNSSRVDSQTASTYLTHNSALMFNIIRDNSLFIENSAREDDLIHDVGNSLQSKIKVIRTDRDEIAPRGNLPVMYRETKPWEHFKRVEEYIPIRCTSSLTHRNYRNSPTKSKSPGPNPISSKSSKSINKKFKLNRLSTRPKVPSMPTSNKQSEPVPSLKLPIRTSQERKLLKERMRAKEEPKVVHSPVIGEVIQLSLSFKNAAESLQNEQMNLRIKEKLDSLKAAVDKQLEEPINLDISGEWEKHDKKISKITEYSIQFIKKQFLKPEDSRDYQLLDSIFKKLTFFQRFPYHVRVSLLKKAMLECYENGTVIFKQGDTGDNMFVIVRGCVAIKKKSKDISEDEIYVNSLYDGAQFGELALIRNQSTDTNHTLRRATCVAAEDTVVLAIPKVEYHEILLKELHHDIESKIQFFAELPLFKGFDVMDLIPLATTLEATTYKHNDIILPKGQQPNGLYLICSGHCTAYTEGFTIRRLKGDQYSNARIRKPSPKKFYTGSFVPYLNDISQSEIEKNDPLHNITHRETSNIDEDGLKNLSRYIPASELDTLGEDRYVLKERIPFVTLNKGDFFGGRALIEGNIIDSNSYLDTEGDDIKLRESNPSKFSIVIYNQIAEASEVKILIITKHHINYLSEKVAVPPI